MTRKTYWTKGVFLLSFFSFFSFDIKAQDIHFSMFDLDPLLFNPAYSGFFDATARFGAVYRNQWASVSTPFQTVSATAEVALSRSRRNRNKNVFGRQTNLIPIGRCFYIYRQSIIIPLKNWMR